MVQSGRRVTECLRERGRYYDGMTIGEEEEKRQRRDKNVRCRRRNEQAE